MHQYPHNNHAICKNPKKVRKDNWYIFMEYTIQQPNTTSNEIGRP